MSSYTTELALADVVMRVGHIRTQDDLDHIRAQIEYERDQWSAVVQSRQQQLIALNEAMRVAQNQEREPS